MSAGMTETHWITGRKVREFEQISRNEVSKRGRSGELPRKQEEVEGEVVWLYDSRYMSYDARMRMRDSQLAALFNPHQTDRDSPGFTSPQGSMFPEIDRDKQVFGCIASKEKKDVALRRLCAIQPTLNHDYAALGYTKLEYLKLVAHQTGLKVRTLQRLAHDYKHEGPTGLLKDTPGPPKGTGEILDASMKAFIEERYLRGLISAQIYRDLKAYLRIKQESPGCRTSHPYRVPSEATVLRFIHRLANRDGAARNGPDALKAACGHVDRRYDDLAALERVESDECKLNLFSFDARRVVNRNGEPWVRRYWLLTFYDARSTYPLVWTLCEGNQYELRRGIAIEDEINLFCRLVREFGIPDAIHSDRGRFRGKEWGGEPFQQRIDREFEPVNGILQRVGHLAGLPNGIRHDMPRVHNPRGTRLERFHRWIADWFRGKPGWIGANTRERKMTKGDAEKKRHELWCLGKLAPRECSPLWERGKVVEEVNRMMEAWRDHNSEGTDMNGRAPRAVFVQCSPPAGFRRISDADLEFATAQHFENRQIALGGIIELPDGTRYSHPLLCQMEGQKREIVRRRDDHSFITVLPAQKGEEKITAKRRARIGKSEPDQLAREMELQARIQRLTGPTIKPLELNPSTLSDTPAPKAADVIHPSEFSEPQIKSFLEQVEEATSGPLRPQDTLQDEREISSVEYMMENDRYKKVKPMDFADLED